MYSQVINLRRAYILRVTTVLCLFNCVSVSRCASDTTLQASVVKATLKFRHQPSVNGTLECFDNLWILLTMLHSRDMAKSVRVKKLTNELASRLDFRACDHLECQSSALAVLIEHMLIFQTVFL